MPHLQRRWIFNFIGYFNYSKIVNCFRSRASQKDREIKIKTILEEAESELEP